MSITDELRDWAKKNQSHSEIFGGLPPKHPFNRFCTVEDLLAIADRIDAEHERRADETLHKSMAWHKLHRRYRRCGELVLDLLAEVEASTRFKRRVHPLRYKEYAERAEELGIKEVDA